MIFPAQNRRDYISYLTGKTGDIIIGIYGRGEGSTLYRDGGFILYCSSMIYKDEAGTYSSSCYGDGWDAGLEYVVSGESREMLSNLERAISSKINKADANLLMHWAARTPAFLLLFITASLIPYILLKSYNYVKSG